MNRIAPYGGLQEMQKKVHPVENTFLESIVFYSNRRRARCKLTRGICEQDFCFPTVSDEASSGNFGTDTGVLPPAL